MTTATPGSTIDDAAARAPRGPGVYVFLGAAGDLLYVGKARDLRRRLSDHARTPSRKTTKARDVRWIECADEAEALCLEADLVVALSPPFNATMAGESYEYVCLQVSDGSVTFVLTDAPSGRLVYGGFPHLGKGKVSWPAVRSKAGYSALLRLLWVAHADPSSRFRIPARLHGDSPPVLHESPLGAAGLPVLKAFLSGRDRRLLETLAPALELVPPFMRIGLERDLEAAEQFYWLGPCRTRTLRTQHGLRSPVDEDSFRRSMIEDLHEAIGAFVAPTRAPGLELAGRRTARSIARRDTSPKRFG